MQFNPRALWLVAAIIVVYAVVTWILKLTLCLLIGVGVLILAGGAVGFGMKARRGGGWWRGR